MRVHCGGQTAQTDNVSINDISDIDTDTVCCTPITLEWVSLLGRARVCQSAITVHNTSKKLRYLVTVMCDSVWRNCEKICKWLSLCYFSMCRGPQSQAPIEKKMTQRTDCVVASSQSVNSWFPTTSLLHWPSSLVQLLISKINKTHNVHYLSMVNKPNTCVLHCFYASQRIHMLTCSIQYTSTCYPPDLLLIFLPQQDITCVGLSFTLISIWTHRDTAIHDHCDSTGTPSFNCSTLEIKLTALLRTMSFQRNFTQSSHRAERSQAGCHDWNVQTFLLSGTQCQQGHPQQNELQYTRRRGP